MLLLANAWNNGLIGALIASNVTLIVAIVRLTNMLNKLYFAGVLVGKVE
jgi:hypothetical protein